MKPLNLELERLESRVTPGGIGLPDVDISASAEVSGSGSKSSGSKGSGSKESGSKDSASKSSGSKGSGSK